MANEVRNILKTCSVCKGTFPTLRELIDHEKRHRLVETPNPVSSIKTRIAANVSTSDTGNGKSVVLYDSFKCPHCPAFVASWSNFGTHLRRWHRDLVETPQLLPRKNVAVNTDPALESPKRQLSEVWRYRCDFCPAAFAHRRTFMQHRLLHLKGKTDDFDGEKDDGKAEMEEAGTEIESIHDQPNDDSAASTAANPTSTIAKSLSSQNHVTLDHPSTSSSCSQVPVRQELSSDSSSCIYCLANFSSRHMLARHHRLVHSKAAKSKLYFCSRCTKRAKLYFGSKEDLYLHASIQHGLETGKEPGLGEKIDTRACKKRAKKCSENGGSKRPKASEGPKMSMTTEDKGRKVKTKTKKTSKKQNDNQDEDQDNAAVSTAWTMLHEPKTEPVDDFDEETSIRVKVEPEDYDN